MNRHIIKSKITTILTPLLRTDKKIMNYFNHTFLFM